MHKIMTPKYYLLIFLLFATSISGCAEQEKQHIRDEEGYERTSTDFSGQWWDYYDRGRYFSGGRYRREAITDFRKAIEGNDKDQWRVRIDDTHFIDYFPHRELGVIYFHRKQYDLAISELEESILSTPSAKGYYFLNKARGAKIRQENRDMSAPELELEGSSNKIITNSFTYTIKGVAEDESRIASIQVGNIQVPVELAEEKRVFTVEVPLQEGENVIQMKTTDLLGKSTEQNLEILCDRSGPSIEMLRVEHEGENEVVRGIVSDEGGVKSLEINGRPWKITGRSSAYNFKFARTTDGVTVVATDHAHNTTRATLNVEDLQEDPLLNPLVDNIEPFTRYYPDPTTVSDAHPPLPDTTQEPPADTDPPFIKMKNLDQNQETYKDHALLEGMVMDFSPIQSLEINGETIVNRNGRKLFFSQLKKLTEGDNEFLIIAHDTHGNRLEKKINIHRKVQNIHQTGSRLSVAILPFDRKGEISPAGDLIHDQMINSFSKQKRFNLADQEKTEAILRELALSKNLVEPNKTAEQGNILAVHAILTGTIIESPESVEIIGHLVDTETGIILASNDVFGEDKSLAALNSLLDTLASKFKRDFPLFEGILIEVKNGEVVIDIGSERRIKPNQRLICYRDGFVTRHPVTRKILGAEPEILADLTVKEVFSNSSKASLQKQRGEVRAYDRFIAR